MNPDFAFGGVYIANAPVTATLALVLALLLHRLLLRTRFYRLVWHPILFDTALFLVIWALITLCPLPFLQGLLP